MSGPWVGAAAPAENIVALGYDGNPVNALQGQDGPIPISGTSFAAAYVSGLAALLKQRFPDLTPAQIINRITATARHPGGGVDNYVGAGVIDPVAALTWDVPAGPETSSVQGQADSAAGVRSAAGPRTDHRGRRHRRRAGARAWARRAGPTRVEAPMKNVSRPVRAALHDRPRHLGGGADSGVHPAVHPARSAVAGHHAGGHHRACRGADDPRPTAHRLGRGGVRVAAAPPQCPRRCRRSPPSVRR